MWCGVEWCGVAHQFFFLGGGAVTNCDDLGAVLNVVCVNLCILM